MTETVTEVPTDFYTDEGFLKSINITSHPQIGHIVVMDGRMYRVMKVSWDFDVGGIPVLVRINVSDSD